MTVIAVSTVLHCLVCMQTGKYHGSALIRNRNYSMQHKKVCVWVSYALGCAWHNNFVNLDVCVRACVRV